MKIELVVNLLAFGECLTCAVALVVILWRRQFANFMNISLFLSARLLADIVMAALMVEMHRHGNNIRSARPFYDAYFYTYWGSYALEACLLLMCVYGVYRLAMAPLQGLQRLGTLVFRWAAAISLAVTVGLAFGPHLTTGKFIIRFVSQLQQTSSILTLCLLLFVCFAIRPMGLSYRSRIFGVSLGLGTLATSNLLLSAWIVSGKHLYSSINIINGVAICAAFCIWTAYFVLPEPKRRMIILPTTSPFLRWNQISQALGDEPGYVAIAGVPPEMFADAEIEVMKRASRKMVEYPEMA